MKKYVILVLACWLFGSFTLHGQVKVLPRAIPETEGVPSQALVALFDSLMSLPQTEIHSVMVLRHGKVIGEIYPKPFAPAYKHTMYSCSKTFVAAAVGLAIEENRLRLDDRVGAFFPEMLPDSVSSNLAAMTVRHLLTMTSGITPDWNMRSRTAEWIKTYLSNSVVAPGTKFQYDSICSYLLAAIVQKVTGQTLLDYLKDRVFTPMGILDVEWEVSPEGYNTGGWGLHIQSESLAKFGLLLLQGGNWQGRQLLPADWIKQMMTEQHPGTGYGYQMWKGEYPGAWDLDGALGQYVLLVPDKDMVIVITECTLINGINQRKLVWNRLLPQVVDRSLPLSPQAYKRLQRRQQTCTLPTVDGKANSPLAARVESKTFTLSDNAYGWKSLQLRFDRKDREAVLCLMSENGDVAELRCGYNRWAEVAVDECPPYSILPVGCFQGIERPFHVAGSYGWVTAQALRLKIHYVDWVSSLDILVSFENEARIQMVVQPNYSSAVDHIEGTAL